MIRFRKYKDLNFFSYFALTNYVALACCLLALFLPLYSNHNANATLTLIDVVNLGYTLTSIMAVVAVMAMFVVFFFNLFFQPSWFVYISNIILTIYLFVSSIFINFKLLPLLQLHQSSLTLNIGSILLMCGAFVYAILEIYKVSVMDEFVNANITEKKDKLMQEFVNSRRFKMKKDEIIELEEPEENEEQLEQQTKKQKKQKKTYRIRRPRIKSQKHFKPANLITIDDFKKLLDRQYKI